MAHQVASRRGNAARLLVQLRNSDGVCWEAAYSAPARKNTIDGFKDKAD